MHKHGGDIYSYPNFIDFSANINFLGVPKAVKEAAQNALQEIIHYPQPGSIRLCQAVAEMEHVKSRQVICGNGAADVIFSVILAEKPKKALIPAPTFQEYEQALLSVDCQVKFANFFKGKTSGITPEENFIEEITNDIDMVFFCNPNNPTGILQEREYVLRLLQKCEKAGARLVVDECFLDFVTGAEDVTMKPFLEEYENLFLVKAFTKMFAIPGIRLGYGLSSDEILLAKMKQVTQPWNVSVIAQKAGVAATKESGFVERTKEAVAEEKKYLLEELNQLPVEIYGHAANFIFFRAEKGLEKRMEQYHILIRDCSNFRGLEKGWYRIAVRSRKENQALIQGMKKALLMEKGL